MAGRMAAEFVFPTQRQVNRQIEKSQTGTILESERSSGLV